MTKEDDSDSMDNNALTTIDPPARWYKYDNVALAQGYSHLAMGRGALVMSNIFLSTAFIYLASEEAGCLTPSGDEVLDSCDEEVYGFKPSSFVTNIAVISGVLSALFMPFFGAMVDSTKHRKTVGVISALLMMMVQAAQIGIVSQTWFAFAILQAVAGFMYQVQVLAVYAYLPDMARVVGQERMTDCK